MSSKVKVVVVGDGAVGKTCLLWAYANNEVPPDYVPTVFDDYVVKLQVNNQNVNLQLCDTVGQEDIQSMRALSYTNTDVFLICFNVAEPVSLENAKNIWLNELKTYVKDPVFLLVGLKKDLRNDEATLHMLSLYNQQPVTFQKGQQAANEMKAAAYCECSAKLQDGVKNVFDQALIAAFMPKGGNNTKPNDEEAAEPNINQNLT